MKIGNKLKKLRELHNYTQEYVAGCVDISTSQYCKYEKEDTPITIETISKLASIYKMAPLELLGWDEKSPFEFYQENEEKNAIKAITKNDRYLDVLIKQLQDENSFLRNENNRLWTIIEKFEK